MFSKAHQKTAMEQPKVSTEEIFNTSDNISKQVDINEYALEMFNTGLAKYNLQAELVPRLLKKCHNREVDLTELIGKNQGRRTAPIIKKRIEAWNAEMAELSMVRISCSREAISIEEQIIEFNKMPQKKASHLFQCTEVFREMDAVEDRLTKVLKLVKQQ